MALLLVNVAAMVMLVTKVSVNVAAMVMLVTKVSVNVQKPHKNCFLFLSDFNKTWIYWRDF